jgi:ketopantoate reductase
MASIARVQRCADAVAEEVIMDMLTEMAADSTFRPSILVDLEKGRSFEREVIRARL